MKFRIVIHLHNYELIVYDNVEYIRCSNKRYLTISTVNSEVKFSPDEYSWFELAGIIE